MGPFDHRTAVTRQFAKTLLQMYLSTESDGSLVQLEAIRQVCHLLPEGNVRCRMCDSGRLRCVLDFGATPPCENFLTAGQLDLPESTFALHLRLCEDWEHAFRFTIHDPAQVDKDRPDVVLAPPWNLETALTEQLAGG